MTASGGIMITSDIPAISNHAHPFCFSHAIEAGTLLEILLATNTLGITKSCLSERIDVSPS